MGRLRYFLSVKRADYKPSLQASANKVSGIAHSFGSELIRFRCVLTFAREVTLTGFDGDFAFAFCSFAGY